MDACLLWDLGVVGVADGHTEGQGDVGVRFVCQGWQAHRLYSLGADEACWGLELGESRNKKHTMKVGAKQLEAEADPCLQDLGVVGVADGTLKGMGM